MTTHSLSRRERISTIFQENRFIISLELVMVTLLQVLDAKGFPAIFFTFPLSWTSLWLRKYSWQDLGLRRPVRWLRTIGLAVFVGLAYSLIELMLVEPVLEQLGVGAEDLSQYASIRGSIPVLIVWLIIGWLIGAFMEEMVFRGYLLNRFTDLLGKNWVGWAIGLLASSAFFGIGHAYLGPAGVVQTFLEACMWGGLYLIGRRNLWLPIIAHGTTNTLAFVLMYLGLYS